RRRPPGAGRSDRRRRDAGGAARREDPGRCPRQTRDRPGGRDRRDRGAGASLRRRPDAPRDRPEPGDLRTGRDRRRRRAGRRIRRMTQTTGTTEDRAPEFEDGFGTGRLDPARWFAAYLPQWSSRERSAPTASVEDGRLVLTIAPGQEPWCPEWDGEVRV